MRSRFPLLVAAAVIFAPGWYGDGPPEHPRGSDLAARILAPTVDEGTVRESTGDEEHQLGGRHTKRWSPVVISASLADLKLSAMALVIIWIVAFYPGPLLRLVRLRIRLGRAPPFLQPA
jgi:hypothetical protein